jgi:ribonuclease R
MAKRQQDAGNTPSTKAPARSNSAAPTAPPPQDPNAEREAAKYDNPVPSREMIGDILRNHGKPLSHRRLCKILMIHDAEREEAVRRRLMAMVRDGQAVQGSDGGFSAIDSREGIRGRVIGHRDGFGFVVPGDGSDDLFLHNSQMRRVFDGDEVSVMVTGIDRRGRREGRIIEVLTRNTAQLVGRYFCRHGYGTVVPENTRISIDILVPQALSAGAKEGQMVVIDIMAQPEPHAQPTGRVVEILGDHMAPGMEIDVAIRAHDIPNVWPEEVLAEASKLPAVPANKDKLHRIDLRHLPFVTIDGEDAKDFDDAVYCEKRRGGYTLYVAIADVSHYVPVGSALDEEAKNRSTSVYFPGRVVPMLPEALSNGLCSLNPHVDRLVMVCQMNLTPAGKMTKFSFFEGIIHSQARLTYTIVGRLVDARDEAAHPERIAFGALTQHIDTLHDLYKVLRETRDVRGAIDFETVETRIVFGTDRKIDAIVPVVRNDAHKLIEECMLCANVAAAQFIEKHGLAGLYRVHDGPGGQKLTSLRKYLGELGLELSGGDDPRPADYQKLAERIGERPDRNIVQTMMLRSMSQAVYQPENRGHFGLAYSAYTHFTSPIRRYPDLLVHRAIRHIVRSDIPSKLVTRAEGAKPIAAKRIYPYDLEAMVALGEHCSMAERRADEASREVVAWLKCEYLLDRVGEEFPGIVTAVTAFGIFVELGDLYVEGLVHISALADDFYHFDAAKQRLVGERHRKSFHLGGAVRVQVVRVNLDERKIDLVLVDTKAKPASDGDAPVGKLQQSVRERLARGDIPATPKKGEPQKKGAPNKGGPQKKGAPKNSSPSNGPAKNVAGKKSGDKNRRRKK